MGKRRPSIRHRGWLLELCKLSVLATDIKIVARPSTVRLLDALAAYRNSELREADTPRSSLTVGGTRLEEANPGAAAGTRLSPPQNLVRDFAMKLVGPRGYLLCLTYASKATPHWPRHLRERPVCPLEQTEQLFGGAPLVGRGRVQRPLESG